MTYSSPTISVVPRRPASGGTRQRVWLPALLWLLALLPASMAYAQQPCGQPTTTGPNSPLAFSSSFMNTPPAGNGQILSWQFTAVAGGVYAFSSCNGPAEDTYLRVYDGNNNIVAFNDDNGVFCNSSNASLSWTCPTAGTYRVTLAHFSSGGCATLQANQVLSYRATLPTTGPAVTARSPVRNARTAATTTPVAVTFSQAPTPASAANISIFSAVALGKRTATTSVSGNTATRTPTGGSFRAGETVQVTVPATVANSAGLPAQPQTYQFTTAVSSASPGRLMPQPNTVARDNSTSLMGQVRTADVNEDGLLDLLVTRHLGMLDVLLGQSNSSFTPGTSTSLGFDGSTELTVGDINNDGHLDALVAASSHDLIAVLLGNGMGGFTPATSLTSRGTGLSLGDINSDGNLDLVANNYTRVNSAVTVWLGNGTGSFSTVPGSPFALNSNFAYDVKLADANNDGKLDILAATRGETPQSGAMPVLLGNGTGGFTHAAGSPFSLGGGMIDAVEVAVADINHDGNLDAVTANNFSYSISVMLGNGTGSFSSAAGSPISLGSGNPVRNVYLNDMNGDGYIDLMASYPGEAVMLRGNGTGSFTPVTRVPYTLPDRGESLTTGDLDNDGDVDVAFYGGTSLFVLRNANLPTISSLTPTGGRAGTVVTITGTNLFGAFHVSFNGVMATAISNNTNTSLQVEVPVGATTGNVTVTAHGGTSNGLPFTAPPGNDEPGAATTLNLSASCSATSGTLVNATRTNGLSYSPTDHGPDVFYRFVATGPAATVSGSSTSGASVQLGIYSGTPSALTQVGSTGTGTVTASTLTAGTAYYVRVQATSAGNPAATTFTVCVTAPATTITNVSPLVGGAGTIITITGTNLGTAVSVMIGPAGQERNIPMGQVNSTGTEVTATIAPYLLSGPVKVYTYSNQTTTTSSQEFVAMPDVRGFSGPMTGYAGQSITITGVNFANASQLLVGGVAAVITSISTADPNSNTLTFRVPSTTPAGAAPFTLTTPGGTFNAAGTSGPSMTVQATLTSFSPTRAAVGSTVTLTGTGFSANTFIGIALGSCAVASSYTVVSPTQIQAVVAEQACSGTVTIHGPLGTPPPTTRLTIAPSIVSFSPSNGTPGTVVTVVVSGDQSLSSYAFTFNGTPAAAVSTSGQPAHTYQITVPSGATTGVISFSTVASDGTSNGTAYSATPFFLPPTLTSLSHTSGPVGLRITLNGTNLSGATSVSFNGTSTTAISSNSNAALRVVVPSGATSGNVSVTTPGGTTASLPFTVTPAAVNDELSGATVLTQASTCTTTNGSVVAATPSSYPGLTSSGNSNDVFYQFTAVGRGAIATTNNLTPGSNQYMAVEIYSGSAAGLTLLPISYSGSNGTTRSIGTSTVRGQQYYVRVIQGSESNGPFSICITGEAQPDNDDPAGAIALPLAQTCSPLSSATYGASVTTTPGVSQNGSNDVFYQFTPTTATTNISGRGVNNGSAVQLTLYSGLPSSLTLVRRVAPVYNASVALPTTTLTATGLTLGQTYYVQVHVMGYYSPANGYITGTGPFTICATQPAPVISSLSSGSGSAGASLTLTGSHLDGATSVSFNGTSTTAITNSTATGLTVVVPAGATSGNVVVTTPAGPSNGFPYTVLQDLMVSTTQTLTGSYRNVTIVSGGNATIANAGLQVSGALVVESGGRLTSQNGLITGPGSFELQAGGYLQVGTADGISASGATGAIRVSGTRTFSPEADYAFGNQSNVNTGSGLPAQVRNLLINAGTSVTLTQPVAVRQVLRLQAGVLNLNGQALTLLSDASGTALVVDEGGSTTGSTAAVQRYLNPALNPGPGYRHYSSPVSGSTVADFTTSGFTPVVNPAYNTSTRPLNVTPFPTVLGYEQSRLATASNNLDMFSKGWFSPASLTEALQAGRGYTAHLPASEKVDFTGTLNTGSFSLNLARNSGATASEAGWHHVGNPYPAPLNFALVDAADRPGLDASMYVYESTSAYGGAYRSYVNGIGNPLVATAQGFWVRVSEGQTTASLTLRNSQRLTSYGQQVAMHRGGADLRPQLQLSLRGNGLADALHVYAEAGASTGLDAEFDAVKLPNTHGLNLAAVAGTGQQLAIQGLPQWGSTTVVPLTVQAPAAGFYTFEASQLLNLPAGTQVFLRDALTGTSTLLAPGTSYRFSLSSTSATGRFSLELRPAGVLATQAQLLAAQVTVYPNPAHQHLTLARPLSAAGTAPATLLNSLGQVVRTVKLTAGQAETRVDLSGLAAGVYSLRVPLTDGQLITRRVVVE